MQSARAAPTRVSGLGRRQAAVGGRSRRSVTVVAAGGDGQQGQRQPWEFGRFLNTVLYFNRPPSPGDIIRKIFGSSAAPSASASSAAASMGDAVQTVIPASGGAQPSEPGVVLVTGATGGTGRRVVARLLARGRRVRALVRDVQKARQLLAGLPAAAGGSLELVAADVTQRQTLLPEMFVDVRQVVSCSAVTVAPKEGDTADRKKYLQGIKFYDPQIVGDTPESVEWRGMQHLLGALGGRLGSASRPVYSPDGSGAIQGWGSLDDVVMGGVSQSNFSIVSGAGEGGGLAGVFAGNVTTANNGGFASVRCRNIEPPLDLSAFDGLELRVKGNGLRYKCIIRTDPGWDAVGYTLAFDTTDDGWQTVRLPFADFKPVFRARTMMGMPALNPASVCSIQLMFSKFEQDGALNPTFREGAFSLPLQRISGYVSSSAPPRWVHVSSSGVTRPSRPGIDIEKEPPAVRMNDMLGGILDYKLKAEDELRGSGVPFAIVRPTALTEEAGGMPLVVEQGDTLKGKVSREDVAELCVALLEQPAARDTTFEVGSSVPFSQPWTEADAGAAAAQRNWGELLGGLRQRVTGKTVDGRYLGLEPEPEPEGEAQQAGKRTATAAV